MQIGTTHMSKPQQTEEEQQKHSVARPRVVIVGAGFGGLTAAKALSKVPVQVTVIDRSSHHLFQPMLYEVATAGLSIEDISAPICSILSRQRNTEVLILPDRVSQSPACAHPIRLGLLYLSSWSPHHSA